MILDSWKINMELTCKSKVYVVLVHTSKCPAELKALLPQPYVLGCIDTDYWANYITKQL